MREIKFRIWDKVNKKIWQWRDIGHLGIFDIFDPIPDENDPLIPMQYTGLKDKNEVEIYEGDILWDGDPHMVRFGETDETIGFYLEEIYNSEHHTLFAYTTPFEIIGNIYENPKLLKK